ISRWKAKSASDVNVVLWLPHVMTWEYGIAHHTPPFSLACRLRPIAGNCRAMVRLDQVHLDLAQYYYKTSSSEGFGMCISYIQCSKEMTARSENASARLEEWLR